MALHKAELLAIENFPGQIVSRTIRVAFMLQANELGEYQVAVHKPVVDFHFHRDREALHKAIVETMVALLNDTTAVCSHCYCRKPNAALYNRAVGKVCQDCYRQTDVPSGHYTIGHDGVVGHGVD